MFRARGLTASPLRRLARGLDHPPAAGQVDGQRAVARDVQIDVAADLTRRVSIVSSDAFVVVRSTRLADAIGGTGPQVLYEYEVTA
jgi:hypothetical protein